MSIEIFDSIFSKLRLRELRLKSEPLPHDAPTYELDIEDSFLENEDDPEFQSTLKVNPNSEPE